MLDVQAEASQASQQEGILRQDGAEDEASHQQAACAQEVKVCISDPKVLQKLTDVDCFSLMCWLVRYLLVTALERNWGCISTDIKNAFPCAKLPEPVWIEVPKFVLDMYLDPKSNRYDFDKYEELKNSYAFVSSA